MEELLGKTVIDKNETCWNSQLKVVQQLVEIDVDKVVDKREFQLNPLEFWQLKATEYPLLAKLASKVFTVPATAALVECVSSQASKLLSPLRCRMLLRNITIYGN